MNSAKRGLLILSLIVLLVTCLQAADTSGSLVDYVNPLMGTDSEFQLSPSR